LQQSTYGDDADDYGRCVAVKTRADPRLEAIVTAWETLSDDARAAIVATVKAVAKGAEP